MPYKDENKRKEQSKIRSREWRLKNIDKVKARRKFLRDNFPTTKKAEKLYYEKNKEKIAERVKEYNKNNPEVRKRAQQKAVQTGKSKLKGIKERQQLKPAYVAAQIRKTSANKDLPTDIFERSVVILKGRLKKKINKLSDYKVCLQCQKLLPIDEFLKLGRVKYQNRNSRCKKCYREHRKKYNVNTDKQRATNKRYYLNNKEKIQQRQKLWREKHNNIKKSSI